MILETRELIFFQGCISWVWFWHRVRIEFRLGDMENRKCFARYAYDPNLGMLGAKQMGRHWSRTLDVAVPNPIRNIHAQVLKFDPV